MKWTRHQLAPAMPGQEIVDRAVAGWVSDGLLVGGLKIVDVQHLAGPGRLAEPRVFSNTTPSSTAEFGASCI
jgi:hypothetical protein